MPFTQAIGCQGDKRLLLSKPRVAGLPRCTALYTRQCVFLYLNVFHSFAFNYPPCALAEWSCFSIFGQELSVQSVLFDLQEYVVSLKAVSTSPFLPFFWLPLSSFECLSKLCNKSRWEEKLLWRGAVNGQDGEDKKEEWDSSSWLGKWRASLHSTLHMVRADQLL